MFIGFMLCIINLLKVPSIASPLGIMLAEVTNCWISSNHMETNYIIAKLESNIKNIKKKTAHQYPSQTKQSNRLV